MPYTSPCDDGRRVYGYDEAGNTTTITGGGGNLAFSYDFANRLLKVARTLADLRGAERIGVADIAEAIQYRALDRRFAE